MMIGKMLLMVVAAAAIAIGGCSKKSEPVEPAAPAITEENLDAELDKLEAEVEADIAAEQ